MEALLIPLTLALTQVAKVTMGEELSKRCIPIVAVLIGIVTSYFLTGLDAEAILGGVIAGLSAVGLWEVGSKAMGK